MNLALEVGGSNYKRPGMGIPEKESPWVLGCLFSIELFFQRLSSLSLGGGNCQGQVVGS